MYLSQLSFTCHDLLHAVLGGLPKRLADRVEVETAGTLRVPPTVKYSYFSVWRAFMVFEGLWVGNGIHLRSSDLLGARVDASGVVHL